MFHTLDYEIFFQIIALFFCLILERMITLGGEINENRRTDMKHGNIKYRRLS